MAEHLREAVGSRYQDEDGWNGRYSMKTTEEAKATVSHLVVIPGNDGGLVITLWAGGMEVEIGVEPDGRIGSVYSGPPEPTPKPVSTGDLTSR